MRVLIAPPNQVGEDILAKLAEWSGNGFLDPFCWWHPDAGTAEKASLNVWRVWQGVVEQTSLPRALQGTPPEDVALFAVFAGTLSQPIVAEGMDGLDRCLAGLADVIPFDPSNPTEVVMVALPAFVGQSVPADLFRAAWGANVYIAPEDLRKPGEFNQLPGHDERFVPHAAHGLACVAELWRGRAQSGLHEVLTTRAQGESPSAVRVVRTFTRGIEFGHLPDHIAAAVFQPGEGWPNPDPKRYDRLSNAGDIVPAVGRSYLRSHEDVFGLSDFQPIRLPELEAMGLWAAVKYLFRTIVDLIKRKPREIVEETIARAANAAAAQLEGIGKKLGTDIKVVRYRAGVGSEFWDQAIARLEEPLVVPDGAVAPAWGDLMRLSYGLIDGSPLPSAIDEALISRGDKRALISKASSIGPDPRNEPAFHSPLSELHRACDPVSSESRLRGLRTMIAHEVAESAADALGIDNELLPGEAEGPPPAVAETNPSDAVKDDDLSEGDSGAFDEAEQDTERRKAWAERHRRSLLWMVGAAIGRNLLQAYQESIPPDHTLGDEAAKEREEQRRLEREAFLRSERMRRRIGLISVTVGAIWAAAEIWARLATFPAIAASVLLAILVLLAMAWVVRRSRQRQLEYERTLVQADLDRLNATMLRMQRAGDKIRLRRRYAEYLDWAEMITFLVHHPWVADAIEQHGEGQALNRQGLPSAFSEAVATVGKDRIDRISAQARHRLLAPGWLSGHYTAVSKAALSEALLVTPEMAEMVELPDPAADTSEDSDSPRRSLLRAIRRGDYRRLQDNAMTLELLELIGDLDLDLVADAIDPGFDAEPPPPLPPSPLWYGPRENLGTLTRELAPTAVKLRSLEGENIESGGVLLENGTLVATSLESLKGQETLEVRLANGSTARGTIVRRNDAADVALLEITEQDGAWRRGVAIAPNSPRSGEGIRVAVAGADSTIEFATVSQPSPAPVSTEEGPAVEPQPSSESRPFLLMDSAVHFRGAPIYDLGGLLIGLQGAIAEPQDEEALDAELSAIEVISVDPIRALERSYSASAELRERTTTADPRHIYPLPSEYLDELTNQTDRAMLLRGHWEHAEDENVVERTFIRPDTPSTSLTDLSPMGKLAFLEPLRLVVHRVDLTRPSEPEELASCGQSPNQTPPPPENSYALPTFAPRARSQPDQ